MDHFAGLDVSVKETSVCIVDDTDIGRAFNGSLVNPHPVTCSAVVLAATMACPELLECQRSV
jgi:hypothetical protein